MKRTLILASALFLLAATLPAHAQNPPDHPAKAFYHLKFVVEELGPSGQIVNTRTYQTAVATDSGTQTIKTGSRVPIATGSYGGSDTKPENVQFQYIDLGTELQVRDLEVDGDSLALYVDATLSSLAGHPETIEGVQEPVIRQNTWNSEVLIPLNKPTVIFSSDDLDSKGRMQIEVTATRLR